MTTKIKFFTGFEELEQSLPVVPAAKFWPEWFKKQRPNIDNSETYSRDMSTVRRCPAVLDVLGMGYVIPLWCDFKVTRVAGMQGDELRFSVPQNVSRHFIANIHPEEQLDAYPFGPDTFKGSFKFINPWELRTPPGYSAMVVSPYYHNNPNLEVMNGVVDTDIYHELHINTFFTAPLNEEVTFERGMPLAQIIPFKRENFESETAVGDHRSSHSKLTQFIHNSLFKAQHYRPKLLTKRYK
jgi:hypothetical protein